MTVSPGVVNGPITLIINIDFEKVCKERVMLPDLRAECGFAIKDEKIALDIEEKEKQIRDLVDHLPEAFLSKAFVAIQAGLARTDAIESVPNADGKKMDKASRSIVKKRLNRSITRTNEEIEVIRRALGEFAKIRRLQASVMYLSRRSVRPFVRRGNLIAQLHQTASVLPIFLPDNPDCPPPPGSGNVLSDDWTCNEGDQVVMQVESGDPNNTNWILGEVVATHENDGVIRYEVEDVDTDSGGDRYYATRKSIIPLPKYRINPLTHPEALFHKDSTVLALFPQTTCFYTGQIVKAPDHVHLGYVVRFEDTTYSDGLSPPMEVPQLYVVGNREDHDTLPATPVDKR